MGGTQKNQMCSKPQSSGVLCQKGLNKWCQMLALSEVDKRQKPVTSSVPHVRTSHQISDRKLLR